MSPFALLLLLAAAPVSTFVKPDAETLTPLGKSETTDGIVKRRCSRYGAYTLLVTEDPGLIGNEIRLGRSCDDKKSVKLADAAVLGVTGPWLAVSDEPFGILMNVSVYDLRTAKQVLTVSAESGTLRFVERSKGRWVLALNAELGRNCRPADVARCLPDAGLKPPPTCTGAKAEDVVQLTAPAKLNLSQPGSPPRFTRGGAVTCSVQP